MSSILPSLVSIIDDDPSIRRSLKRLLVLVGYQVETFESALDFLENGKKSNCLLLDLQLPGMSGLDLQEELLQGNLHTPIIFITGNGNIPKSVQAIRAGAIDFLEKPFEEEDLLRAIEIAVEKDRSKAESEYSIKELRHKIFSLTPREHEVFTFVITGIPNKAIASELGASEKTIKVHRGRLMHKLCVVSIVELVRLADKAGVKPALVAV